MATSVAAAAISAASATTTDKLRSIFYSIWDPCYLCSGHESSQNNFITNFFTVPLIRSFQDFAALLYSLRKVKLLNNDEAKG